MDSLIKSQSKNQSAKTQSAKNQGVKSQFPQSPMTVSRDEFGDNNPQAKAPRLALRIKEGDLPQDLQGHVFVIGPAGSIDSPKTTKENTVIPSKDGFTMPYNGDGIVYRFDFDQPEVGAYMASRIVKPPCYYADVVTNKESQFHGSQTSPNLRFSNNGISRMGKLGMRNQVNTAFLPLKFAHEDRARLLVTWDVGRPYEIDPATLATITPVGSNQEWKPVTSVGRLPWQPPTAFEVVQTAAHPLFDPHTNGGEMFTVNLGRSISNSFSQLIPIAYLLKELKDWLFGWKNSKGIDAKPRLDDEFIVLPEEQKPEPETFRDKLRVLLGALWQFFHVLITFFKGNFVDLIVWDGKGAFQKWNVRCNGRPIKIQQSAHQLGITKDYIVLLDTAFKLAIEELLPPLKQRNSQRIEKFIRDVLAHPQLANNHLYIIRRQDLQRSQTSGSGKIPTVNAQKIVLPLEAAHFLVDYENPDGCLTIHFSHVCAWDAAEAISALDYKGEGNAFERLYGVIYSPTDISRLGCTTLKITAAGVDVVRPQATDMVIDPDLTWAPAIYAYRNGTNYGPPKRIDHLYWSCLGCVGDLLKPHIEDLYRHYPYREYSLEKIRTVAKEGIPAALVHLHITPIEQAQPDESRVSIAGAYQFEKSFAFGSPQFIPARGTDETNDSTAGYIFCIVYHGDGHDETNGNELWLFDAANLSQGPICKLWHPQMDFGFTIHSTWLQEAKERNASYNIPVEEDYKAVVTHPGQYPEVRELFEEWIFEQRIPPS